VQGQAHQNKLLLFQVGPVKCSVFSNDILTIIPPPRQETAGRTGRLPGIFRHNNRIVRVVDMRSKFGLSPSSPERGRLILAEIPKGLVAFWVDQIINVIDQEEGRWDILPAALPHDVFTRTFVLDDELILHTECPRMEAMRPSAGLTEHIEQLQAQHQEKARQTRSPTPATEFGSAAQEAPAKAPTVSKPTEPRPVSPVPSRPAGTEPGKPVPRPTPRPSAAATRPERDTGPRPPPSTSRPAGPARTSPTLAREASTTRLSTRPVSRPEARPVDKKPESIRPTAPAPRPSERPASTPPPRPAATPPAATPRREDAEDEGNGLVWLMVLLLLIFLGGSGALLYFTGFFGQEAAPPPPVAAPEQPTWQPPEPVEAPAVSAETEQPPEPPAEPVPVEAEPESTLAEAAPGPDESAEPLAEPTPEVQAVPAEEAQAATPPYSASIEKDEQGLTITLEGPAQSPQDTLLKEEATTPEPAEPPQAEESAPTVSTEAEVEPKPASKKKAAKRVITHVVVKGDTLWDIAERYVKDPYRYPELARLSGIKNPDLIYPGDIVRIIEK